ncbi:MAG TPA: hypothetical protein VM165_03355 [Planctomycetaceae bacterium]|nr:hypothetical protein [Planctomycetaceae bacterium]
MTAAGEDDAAASPSPWLATWLRAIGVIDLLAVAAVFLPNETLAAIHAHLDLGTWPAAPIAVYLARSASWMYALCGVLLIYLSSDVARYRPLIRFLSACGVATGLVLIGIDWSAGMPWWWTATEGPCCLLLAVVTWMLTINRAKPRGCNPWASAHSGSASSARSTG